MHKDIHAYHEHTTHTTYPVFKNYHGTFLTIEKTAFATDERLSYETFCAVKILTLHKNENTVINKEMHQVVKNSCTFYARRA